MAKKACSMTKEQAAKIDEVLSAHNYDGGDLVSILLEVQELEEKHYISEEVAYYLAEKLSVKVTNVYDCITFYASIYDYPRAKYPLQVCESIVCHVNEAGSLLADLKEIIGVGLNEATADGKFIIEEVPCFGACDMAPAVRVNGKVYGKLNSKDEINKMLADLK